MSSVSTSFQIMFYGQKISRPYGVSFAFLLFNPPETSSLALIKMQPHINFKYSVGCAKGASS